ncbi:ABC transporter permease [Clostridia bacterium OttesenSCG-928-O13]|nr:ABC transporter permease [Clostridia bacterium OttesenSCG-928-O13]
MIVVPSGAAFEGYIFTKNTSGQPVSIGGEGVLMTQNAAELLGLGAGDAVQLQNQSLDKYETRVTEIVEHYLGNTVYVSQSVYEAMFGVYTPNAVFGHLSLDAAHQPAYTQSLLEHDFILSSVNTQALKDDFSSNFTLVNSVLYLLIVLAAGLAFVVLFTLSNTNISERVRELATIKVLGFFDAEVHAYVNKETLILTAIGVLAGLPVGRAISGLLTEALKMPALYFAVYVKPSSYVLAGLISFSFALIVNAMTNRTLDKINMVEALKSVE